MDGDGFLFDTGSNPISRVEEQLNEVEWMFTELCARVNERDNAICNDVVKHILSLLQLQYLSRTSLPRQSQTCGMLSVYKSAEQIHITKLRPIKVLLCQLLS